MGSIRGIRSIGWRVLGRTTLHSGTERIPRRVKLLHYKSSLTELNLRLDIWKRQLPESHMCKSGGFEKICTLPSAFPYKLLLTELTYMERSFKSKRNSARELLDPRLIVWFSNLGAWWAVSPGRGQARAQPLSRNGEPPLWRGFRDEGLRS